MAYGKGVPDGREFPRVSPVERGGKMPEVEGKGRKEKEDSQPSFSPNQKATRKGSFHKIEFYFAMNFPKKKWAIPFVGIAHFP
jgi:hypothetical protein